MQLPLKINETNPLYNFKYFERGKSLINCENKSVKVICKKKGKKKWLITITEHKISFTNQK